VIAVVLAQAAVPVTCSIYMRVVAAAVVV